jgi:hypothetical protein
MTAGAPPQTGVAGAQLVGAVCKAGEEPVFVPAGPPPLPPWLIPAAIGGGALVIFLALK